MRAFSNDVQAADSASSDRVDVAASLGNVMAGIFGQAGKTGQTALTTQIAQIS
jgi:hypothetical protein